MFKERLPSRMESVPAHIARMIALLGPPPNEFLKRGQFSDMYFDEDGELLDSDERIISYSSCLGNFTRDVKVEDTSLEEEEDNLEGEDKNAFLRFLRGRCSGCRRTGRQLGS